MDAPNNYLHGCNVFRKEPWMAVRPRLNLALIQTKLRKMAFFICMDAGGRAMHGAIAKNQRIGFTAMDGGYIGIAGAKPSAQICLDRF